MSESSISCLPNINCLPFDDPTDREEEKALAIMVARAQAEKERELKPTEWESSSTVLKRFLKSNNFDVEPASSSWKEWVKWRHEVGADSITAEDIQDEVSAGLAKWQGKDKDGRLCLVVTGRMLDRDNRKGNFRSFQKFLIRTVEDGVRLADEAGADEVCVLYDRRGLEFSNIDPVLHQMCRKTTDSLKQWYGKRLGAVYVLHMNWFFWILYAVFIKPMLTLLDSSRAFHAVETPDDMLEYFDAENLMLLSHDSSNENETVSPPASSENEESKTAEIDRGSASEGKTADESPVPAATIMR